MEKDDFSHQKISSLAKIAFYFRITLASISNVFIAKRHPVCVCFFNLFFLFMPFWGCDLTEDDYTYIMGVNCDCPETR
jgi:hypothetical protein